MAWAVCFRLCLVAGKRFPENTYFTEMLISGKGKCIRVFGCLGNRFTENQFRCLIRPIILRKSFYGKLIPVFGSSKYFTENTLRKTFSHVWFGKYFTENNLDHFTENDLESGPKKSSILEWYMHGIGEDQCYILLL